MKHTNASIIILHGWGVSGEKYEVLKQILEKQGFHVYTPDLPGFGHEKLTREYYTIDDYSEFLMNFIKKHNIKNFFIIAHSFGGRVAVRFLSSYPSFVTTYKIKGLILTGTPLTKENLSMRKKIAALGAHASRHVVDITPLQIQDSLRKVLYRISGDFDYYRAKETGHAKTMQEILRVNYELELPHITIPTLIIWGGEDTFVPISVGKKINSLIKNSQYKEVSRATHKLPYEYPKEFAEVALSFINKN